MNERLFKPRGLYAMIMTYKPSSTAADEVIDLNQNITKAVGTRYDGHGSKFHSSSGKTRGELQLPEAAPLIFPELDALPDEQKNKKSGHFLGDYFDRRAQAKFEAENPDSKLNVAPRKEFASRFSDPNHPANDGSPISLITGGAVQGRRSRRRARRGGLMTLVDQTNGQKGARPPGQRKGLLGSLKKQMKEVRDFEINHSS